MRDFRIVEGFSSINTQERLGEFPRQEKFAPNNDREGQTVLPFSPFREGAAGAWRNAFIRMPYARERTIERAIINDTFETAITWERFKSFHDKVKAATERAILQATGRAGQVTCRCTH